MTLTIQVSGRFRPEADVQVGFEVSNRTTGIGQMRVLHWTQLVSLSKPDTAMTIVSNSGENTVDPLTHQLRETGLLKTSLITFS